MRNMNMKRMLVLAFLGLISGAFAAGFSVQGAYRYNFDGSPNTLEGEFGYSDYLMPGLEVGGRLALQLDPLGQAWTVLPYGFAEYRQTLFSEGSTAVSGYGRFELGLGTSSLAPFFPRTVLAAGLDGRTSLGDGLDGFGQFKLSHDFIITNRSKIGLSSRVGLIAIPFVPYVAAEYSYDLYPSTSNLNLYVGSLLYLSRQFFVGLEGGYNNHSYIRFFASFGER